jgi:hypothetical protein
MIVAYSSALVTIVFDDSVGQFYTGIFPARGRAIEVGAATLLRIAPKNRSI